MMDKKYSVFTLKAFIYFYNLHVPMGFNRGQSVVLLSPGMAYQYFHRFPAKIKDINDEDMEILIHFDGWNQRYDEWVSMTSEKIRPMTRHSARKNSSRKPKTVSYRSEVNFKTCHITFFWSIGKKFS